MNNCFYLLPEAICRPFAFASPAGVTKVKNYFWLLLNCVNKSILWCQSKTVIHCVIYILVINVCQHKK